MRKEKTTQYYVSSAGEFACAREKGGKYCEPLRIIGLAGAEEGLEGVVPWDHEAGEVGQQLAADVEEDQEEVGADEPEEGVRLGDGRLLLQVVEDGVLGQLGTVLAVLHQERAQRWRVVWGRKGVRRRTSLSMWLM